MSREQQWFTNHGAPVAAPKYQRPQSCNRHDDCAAAEAREREKGRTGFVNFHCYDETCEDCFGS